MGFEVPCIYRNYFSEKGAIELTPEQINLLANILKNIDGVLGEEEKKNLKDFIKVNLPDNLRAKKEEVDSWWIVSESELKLDSVSDNHGHGYNMQQLSVLLKRKVAQGEKINILFSLDANYCEGKNVLWLTITLFIEFASGMFGKEVGSTTIKLCKEYTSYSGAVL